MPLIDADHCNKGHKMDQVIDGKEAFCKDCKKNLIGKPYFNCRKCQESKSPEKGDMRYSICNACQEKRLKPNKIVSYGMNKVVE